ncbi:MAG: dUTP diphosphatase [Hyphomicrobium aestuarii]|nr:dUTP diphosphatase [Hyphomicrobium aestuarii]
MARNAKPSTRKPGRATAALDASAALLDPPRAEPVRIETVRIEIVRLPHASGLPLPKTQTSGSAGIDLIAAVDPYGPIHLAPGKRVLVPTGLVIALPPGYEGQVRPRSGLALKHGVTVLNSPGTIDTDYRGEVKVILINHGDAPFAIERGERIAQLVVAAVAHAELVEVAEITATDRATGGFGSTGKS